MTAEKPAVLTNLYYGFIEATAGPNQSTTAQLNGDIDNIGFVSVDGPLAFGAAVAGSTFDNHGDVELGGTLTAENGAAAVTDDRRPLLERQTRGLRARTSAHERRHLHAGRQLEQPDRARADLPGRRPGLGGASLHRQGKGAIVAEGSTSETGSLAPGQELALESTDSCSGAQDAVLSPAKDFSSAGTITFTHAGSCAGGSDTLMLPSGTELTNSGTLSAVAGTVAGPKQIDGKVKSSGTVSVASGVTLMLDGTLTNMKTATNTLMSGKYSLAGTFEYNNPSFETNGIVTNGAKLTLDGSGAFTDGEGDNALRNLAANTKALTLIGGEDLTTPGSLTDLGTIAVGGATPQVSYTPTGATITEGASS